jgi:glutaredoxin
MNPLGGMGCGTMARRIVLYTAKLCGDCQKLKAFMDARGIAHEVRDIHEDAEYARELEEQTGKLGVPFLCIDGKWVRGYDADRPFSEEFAESLFQFES